MRSKGNVRTAYAIIIIVSAFGMAACGGGGGGDGGGGGPGGGGGGPLLLIGIPGMGEVPASGGPSVVTAFNVNTPSAVTQVGPNDFRVPPGADGSFIQLRFSRNLIASSIVDGQFSGNDGIEIRDNAGNLIPFFLDALGVIDASNAFPAPNVAPSTLRLYVQGGGNVPVGFAAGQYTINLITSRLRGEGNAPLCIFMDGSVCTTNTEIVYSFSIGGDGLPIQPAANPSLPLVNSQIAVDQEIRLFFNENVDFQSLVGMNATTGAVNTTQLDRFMSIPFSIGTMPTAGENLTVAYTPPAPSVLPTNYGFVVYMPDPFRNPTEVRIRFIDQSQLVATDNPPAMVQNYGIDNRIYTAAGFGAPIGSSGIPLRLPPALPLPGSDSTGTASVAVTVFSSGNAQASVSGSDGVAGLADRARNALVGDVNLTFTVAAGPVIANNPSPPDQNFIVNGAVVNTLSTAAVTADATSGGTLTGLTFVAPKPINDPSLLGQVGDIEFGAFLNATNNINNPPRRNNNATVIASGVDPGVPFPPGGTPETGLAGTSPVPPLGVRLYISDTTANLVRVFDSTTFLPLGIIPAVASPRGLGRDPAGQFLYVSNFDQGTVQRVGISPAQTSTFHQVTNTILVGSNPTAISVQPGNEDVFVINSTSNSISIIDVPSAVERAQFPVGAGPTDVFVTPRMICPTCTLAYQAYVTNFFDNTVSIYESDSVSIQVPNGPQGVILQARGGFQGPSGGTWNRGTFATGGTGSVGAFIANATGSTVEQFAMVSFGLAPVPGFMGPPPFRNFQTLQTISGSPGSQPSDFSIDFLTRRVGLMTNPGLGTVDVVDLATGVTLGVAGVAGNRVYSFSDQ